MPEQRTIHVAAGPIAEAEPELLLRCSSLEKLLCITAWCRRALQARCPADQEKPREGTIRAGWTLTADELDTALLVWIRKVQTANYKEELADGTNQRPLKHRTSLAKLHSFVDPQGVLRVGGGVSSLHALLAYDERHLIILPAASRLTKLIIKAYHKRVLHDGVQLTLSALRRKFWRGVQQ
ncbi:uncharacterized protein LOC143908562 [Temnothorax americanus]|uniref:uncharacterized protein LOC143908562 n=1 Tax=Temnothorax americanus TaxID=1964332 RepID=UPI00406891A0